MAATATTRSAAAASDGIEQFLAVRSASRKLTAALSPEDCQPQSMADASPVKWHLAHTTWFFETFVLEPTLRDFRPFHPDFKFLFNSYYQTVGAQHPRPQRGLLTRPSLDQVWAYRDSIDDQLKRAWDAGDLDETRRAIVEIGVHHEQQHQELVLTDLKHLFAQSCIEPAYAAAPQIAQQSVASLRWQHFEGGIQRIGNDGSGFAFDNEMPRHRVAVEAFDLADRLVTNGEYLQFIEDGGYSEPSLWLSDGWATICELEWKAPLYWRLDQDERSTFTLSGRRDLRLDEPVTHLSYYEADAFARWAGARLPSEAEWEIAAGSELKEGNFVESGLFHPRPRQTSSHQFFGDTWEWTQSPYGPYPGFRPPEGALGEYNGKFMANQMTLRGGSCATPRSHVRATYRNFFPPDARWQFSGLRLARDA